MRPKFKRGDSVVVDSVSGAVGVVGQIYRSGWLSVEFPDGSSSMFMQHQLTAPKPTGGKKLS